MESVVGIKWNGWPEWNGIGGRDRLEYSSGSLINLSEPKIFTSNRKEETMTHQIEHNQFDIAMELLIEYDSDSAVSRLIARQLFQPGCLQ